MAVPERWADKSWQFWRQQVAPFAFIVLLLCSLRSSIADWNDVPTGSMKPSILEGDRIFVNKLAYDLKVPFTTWHLAEWGNPQRGDVVVFYSPENGIRMVKRVIAVPGDTVGLVNNRLIVNGQPAAYQPADASVGKQLASGDRSTHGMSVETVDGRSHPIMLRHSLLAKHQSFRRVEIPSGKYFLMGDNRDNSNDSRFWGMVDRSQIVGKAVGVAISVDPERSYAPRWERFFEPLP